MRKNKKIFRDNQSAILFVAAVFLLFWILGLRPGMGQKQEDDRFTVETHDKTNFPLTGRHRTVACGECHLDGVLEGTPTACEACHWVRRQDDRHQLRLGIHCGDCHTPFSWKDVASNKWNHMAVTGYSLEGVHKTLDCVDCHGENGFRKFAIDCFECHEEEYQETHEPDHVAAGFPTQCQLCHLSNSRWEGASFSHDGFILRGQHKAASCSDCHNGGRYQGISTACVSCHLSDYNDADDPDHRKLGFPTDCEICHGTKANSWEDANFSHTAFVLRGRHRLAQCSDCHDEGQYAGISSECISCHLSDYNNADDPDHRALNFPTNCEACHGTGATSWENADFGHEGFVLKGEHRTLSCTACHVNSQYAGLPSSCVSCHLDDYKGTDDPNHQALNFPTDCEVCHGNKAITWEDANFNHQGFVLKGEHRTILCSACHVNNQYAGLPSSCVSCHLDDYQGTDDPDHQALDFPTECEICHGTNAVSWEGASFDHASIWPLQGAHTQLDCSGCHQDGYDLPRDCYGCHAQDYDSTADPNHRTAGFPTDCQICHYPTHFLWTQAVFDHQFPIDSGRHSSASCSDCHVSSNYKEFSCLTCHVHDKTRMDNEHRDVSGYSYLSQACYACHPQGRA